jgi:hypothetical protein
VSVLNNGSKITFKTKPMKKLLLIAIVCAFAISANAQLKGFFSPIDNVVVERSSIKDVGVRLGDVSPWLLRPYFSLTAAAIQFGGGTPKTYALNSFGLGVSYGKYGEVNTKAYCYYSVNLSLLTQVELSGVMSTAFGGALTIDVFDKIIGIGVGYLDKHVMLLTTISYSF